VTFGCFSLSEQLQRVATVITKANARAHRRVPERLDMPREAFLGGGVKGHLLINLSPSLRLAMLDTL